MPTFSDTLSLICKISRIGVEATEYFQQSKEPEGTVSYRVNEAMKPAIIALEVVKCFSMNPELKRSITFLEMACRGTKVVTSLAGVKADDSEANAKEFFGVLAEFGAILKNLNETAYLSTEIRLQLSDEELAKIQWPIYEIEGCGEDATYKLIGYRAFTREEYEEEMKTAGFISKVMATFETITRASIIGSRILGQQAALEAPTLRREPLEFRPEGMFDFLAFDVIPDELHEDPILRNYIDPITCVPIRHAVTNRNNLRLNYEKAAINDYIQRQINRGIAPTCPITRVPISLADIVPQEATQRIINSRLAKLSERLKPRILPQIQPLLETIEA